MNSGIEVLRQLADDLEEEARQVERMALENEQLHAEVDRLRRAHESRGHLMDAYVLTLAEIADGKENPIEFARSVLQQDANALIKRAVDVRNDAGKPEPEKPEPCVWTVNVTENSWILGCDESKDTSAPPKVCPYCGKRVEVRG